MSQTHLILSALEYPWHDADAHEFHQLLFRIIPEPSRIDLEYRRCGSGLDPLQLNATPDVIWKQALELLFRDGLLQNLCHNLRRKFGQNPRLIKTIDKLTNVTSDSPTHGGVLGNLQAVVDPVTQPEVRASGLIVLSDALIADAISAGAIDLATIVGLSDLTHATPDALSLFVDYFSTNFTRLPMADVYRVLDAHLRSVIQALKNETTPRRRNEFHVIASRMAAILGRISQYQGRHLQANTLYASANLLAKEISDSAMMAWLHIERATMAVERGDPREALELANSAFYLASEGNNRLQALTLQARSYAALGEEPDAIRTISAAELAVANVQPGYDSDVRDAMFFAWSRSCTFHALGRASLALTRADEAKRYAELALDETSISTSMWREQNTAHANLVLAGALAQSGSPDEAGKIISGVLAEEQHSGHVLLAQTASMIGSFRKHREMPVTKELIELIRDQMRSAG